MKYMFILLFSLNAYGLTFDERFDALSASRDIRMNMELCGFKDSNMELFRKKVIKDNDEAKLSCLESKKLEVDAMRVKAIDNLARTRQALEDMKKETCPPSPGVTRNLCILFGGQ